MQCMCTKAIKRRAGLSCKQTVSAFKTGMPQVCLNNKAIFSLKQYYMVVLVKILDYVYQLNSY